MDETQRQRKKPPLPLRRIIVFFLGITILVCLGLYYLKEDNQLLILAGTILGVFGQMLTGDSDSADVKEMNGGRQ